MPKNNFTRTALTGACLLAALTLGATPAIQAATPVNTAANKASAQGQAFNQLSHQFIEALWLLDPDAALYAGRYEQAAKLPLPDAATRARQLAFAEDWLQRFANVDEAKLSVNQRTDLAQLRNKLESDRFYLGSFREFEWNPAAYGVASALDLMLSTDYAPLPTRLRALSERIAAIPAYYRAAQASIKNPTLEHTQLAIRQAPGNVSVLDDVAKAGQSAKALKPAEKALLAERIAAAKGAIQGQIDFLKGLEKELLANPASARSFRIGAALYEPKFKLDIQSGRSAEQTYEKALAAREQLLAQMDQLADQLWAKTLGDAPKPADRTAKIGQVIAKLSERHVARADFFKEIRRQIPVLQDWVVKHDLLTMDAKKPLVVRETPVYARGVAGAGIEAPGPYRPQDRTYYSVTPMDDISDAEAESNLREYNHWMLQILNIHEAIPGHYTQLVYANKSPSLVKALFGNGAMVEGWAVFSERLMLESGYGGNEPEMWLMWCKWNLRSVTNTILDYSVHVKGISEAEALDMLIRQAFQTEQEAREKWRRVQLSSVQLTSYFSGYSEIMELREARKAQLGDKFKVKAFNEQFLSYGSAPVHVIRELMMQR